MKAPEQIYLSGYDFDPEPCVRWEREPREKSMRGHKAQHVCYIRKDIHDETIETAEDHAYFAGKEKFREAMLEWAEEEQLKSTTILADDWWQKVIDKLKSL